MASDHRNVSIERVTNGSYIARNVRGGQITVGSSDGPEFTPVELLLAAIGGCTAIDVDTVTSRRAEPTVFVVDVDAEKVKDTGGNHLADIVVTFHITFPEGEGGDAARTVLPDIVRMSHDRLCSVGRTVELGTPIQARLMT